MYVKFLGTYLFAAILGGIAAAKGVDLLGIAGEWFKDLTFRDRVHSNSVSRDDS